MTDATTDTDHDTDHGTDRRPEGAEIREFRSSVTEPWARRLGTFSYLPPLDEVTRRGQVAHLLANGWDAVIEHVEPARATDRYWYLWKLPLFGERDVDAVLAEVAACRDAHPGHHVRLLGVDPIRQTARASFVVARGGPA